MKLEAARFPFPLRHERFRHFTVCDLHYRVSMLFGWAFTYVSLVNDYMGFADGVRVDRVVPHAFI